MKKRALPFIREHRTYCGEKYMTVELFRFTEEQIYASRKKRTRREKVSAPKQRNLNNKRAKRYFLHLVNTNFTERDVIIHLTYANQPESREEAQKIVRNYLRKLARARKKLELSPLKYILVTEGGDLNPKTGKVTRLHHHIIVNGGMDRDELELLWNRKPVNLEKARKDREYRETLRGTMLGYSNTRRLQPGENGLEALAKYLTKDPKGKKRWSASQNLKKPERVTRDHHYSCRNYQKVCSQGEIYTREFWEKKYKGYTLAGSAEIAVEAEAPDDMNDWRVFAKLRKIE